MKLKSVSGREMLRKKGIVRRLYDRAMRFIQWIFDQLKDRLSIAIFIFVLIVMYSPCWLCMLLYSIFGFPTLLAVSTAYMAFWAGPFTPFFPMCFAITFALRKLLGKLFKV
ncbi:MAG: hypothetical protein LUD27_01155 [Clostridia bacterium]|nr:hypothetical protein [Clostridia bacterium]